MNERIRELANQCWNNFDLFGVEVKTPYAFAEKFAKLIVQECIRSVEDVPGRVTRDYDWLVKQTKIHAIEKIKDKFGVES